MSSLLSRRSCELQYSCIGSTKIFHVVYSTVSEDAYIVEEIWYLACHHRRSLGLRVTIRSICLSRSYPDHSGLVSSLSAGDRDGLLSSIPSRTMSNPLWSVRRAVNNIAASSNYSFYAQAWKYYRTSLCLRQGVVCLSVDRNSFLVAWIDLLTWFLNFGTALVNSIKL